jgi:tetratricopeptide (TPR) repeat protein
LESEVEREENRQKIIQGELTDIRLLHQKGDLRAALQKVSALLEREPRLSDALRWKETIENAVRDQEKIVASFQSTFEKGRALYEQMKWEEAIACFRKAYETVADPGLQKWISAAESGLSAQRQIHSDQAGQLAGSRKLIQAGKLEEARRLLDSCAAKITEHFFLNDLRQELDGLNETWRAEVEKEKKRRTALEKWLAESMRLYEQGKHQEASVKVEALLQQQPDMEGALKLKEKIRIALLEKQEMEFSRLLQEATQHIRMRKWDEALELFQRLHGMNPAHPQLKQYLADAQKKARELAAVQQKLQAFSSSIEKYVSSNQWEEAIRTAEKALSANYSDFPVESQLSNLKDRRDYAYAARTKNALDEAARNLQSGNLGKSKQLYEKVLTWEPSNATAQLGLRQTEAAGRPQQAAIPGLPVPVSKKNWIPIAAVLLILLTAIGIWVAVKLLRRPPPTPIPAGPLMTTVTINALPWARVKLTPVSKETKLPSVADEELVTPCRLSLSTGEYVLELNNGTAQLQDRITVSQGAANEFVFYVMGDYNPQDIVAQIGARK